MTHQMVFDFIIKICCTLEKKKKTFKSANTNFTSDGLPLYGLCVTTVTIDQV